jgi:hypothetical protein
MTSLSCLGALPATGLAAPTFAVSGCSSHHQPAALSQTLAALIGFEL